MSDNDTDSPAFPTDPSRWSSIIAEWVKSVKEHGGAVIGPVKIPSPSGPGGSPGGSTPGGGSPSGGDAGGGEDGGGDDGSGEDGGGGEGSGNAGGSGNDSGSSSGSASPTSVPPGGGGGSPSGGDSGGSDDGGSGGSTTPPSGGSGNGGGSGTPNGGIVSSTSGDSNNGGGGVNPTPGATGNSTSSPSVPPSGNHDTTIPVNPNDTGGASNTAPQDTSSAAINGHTSSTSQGETATSQPPPLSSPTATSNLSTTPFTQSTSIPPTSPTTVPPAVSHARARNVNVIAIVVPIVIILLLLTALLAICLFRRRRQLRRQRNGIRFDEDEPAQRPRGGATTSSPANYPTEPIPASGESSFILRHPFAAAYHASTSSATLDSTSNAHPFMSGSVIGSGNFSFASAHQGHGSTPGVHVADINDPFADPYNVLRERHRALLANAATWTPASAISGSGTSYFGESSTGAVEDASRQDLAPGRSDAHLAPPPPPLSESRSHSPHI